jgi:hypothetical protein
MMQKAYAEGPRAVYLYTAAHQDDAVAQHVSGADAALAARVNNLLLPIVKGVGSERAYQHLAESLQCFGGSGFLQDYPIEQYIRDAKIDSLYEGTTAIQAQDFFFRKIARDNGVALAHLTEKITETIGSGTSDERLKTERHLLAAALDDVRAMAMTLTQHLIATRERPAELYNVGLHCVRFLLAVGDLLVGWRLLVAAEIAQAALDSGAGSRDGDFYRGKLAVAAFFAKTVLPRLTADRAIIADTDTTVMELDDASF